MLSNIEMSSGQSKNGREPRASVPTVVCLLVGITVPVLVGGCQLKVNPFRDELAGQKEVTTASVEGARAAVTTPTERHRDYAVFELHAEAQGVTHGPLYFEDPYEDNGSDDGQFAWTGEDYFWILYWRGRFLVNAVFFPVSAVVTPPWTVMESDGRLGLRAFGEQLDAEQRVEPPVHEPAEAAPAGG